MGGTCKLQVLIVYISQNKFIVDFFLLSLYKDNDGVFKWKFNTEALKTFVAQREVDKINSSLQYSGPSLIIYGGKSNYVR